jgi:hypothetical protein
MKCRVVFSLAVALQVGVCAAPLCLADASIGFLENRGQLDEQVRFYAPGSGTTLYFTPDAVVIDLRGETAAQADDCGGRLGLGEAAGEDGAFLEGRRRGCAIWISFQESNASVMVEARGELPGYYNYFLGCDPARWRTGIRAYAEVVYRDLWPGVDLVCRRHRGAICCEALRSPGMDPEGMRLRYEGADRITPAEDGSALIESPLGDFVGLRSAAGQEVGAFLRAASAEDRCSGSGDSSSLKDASTNDRDDPSQLLWSTFLGGGSDEGAHALALDPFGNPVVAGLTWSANFPATPGAYDCSYNGGGDALVAKLDVSGSALTWCTFLGGSSVDAAYGVVLDPCGNPIVTGFTQSHDFPVTPGVLDESHNGATDVFVSKLDASGSSLIWSTFLGGGNSDAAAGLALDPLGNPVVAGYSRSASFPTTPGAYDESHNGDLDAFVFKLDGSGADLLWSTFLGGGFMDGGYSIAVDSFGNPILAGFTESADFPTTMGAYDESQNGSRDVFVAKLDPSGSILAASSFLGGTGFDTGYALALDTCGNPVVIGSAGNGTFPVTEGAYDWSYNGGSFDVFVAKMDASNADLIWSTFLGGSRWDEGFAVVLDPSGSAVVTGYTQSSNFPTTAGAFDESYNGSTDAFVAKLDASGSFLRHSSFVGGSSSDVGNALGLDTAANAVLAGETGSSDFPTTEGAYDGSYNGGSGDVFVTGLSLSDFCGVSDDRGVVCRVALGSPRPSPATLAGVALFPVRLNRADVIHLDLYDAEGRLLCQREAEPLSGGTHIVKWTPSSVSPGVHFVRLTTHSGASARVKWVVVR